MAGGKKRPASDREILREFTDFVKKGPPRPKRREVIDLPPWQPDAVYSRTYGQPTNVFAIVMVPTGEDGEEGAAGSSVVIRLDPPPLTWRELRTEQRAQFGIYGSDYLPYSRGHAA